MIIETVKLTDGGWQVNGNMGVPNDPDNRYCQDVLAWIAEGNTPTPEFTDAEIAANTQAELNVTSRAYLASTDWYITRKAETGDAVPSEITTLRTAARDAIV
jgi:hypothetical protein